MLEGISTTFDKSSVYIVEALFRLEYLSYDSASGTVKLESVGRCNGKLRLGIKRRPQSLAKRGIKQ